MLNTQLFLKQLPSIHPISGKAAPHINPVISVYDAFWIKNALFYAVIIKAVRERFENEVISALFRETI